jgi:short-subunit dehydrogenase
LDEKLAKRSLRGLRAIVTGASSGIGWHLSKQLAAAGVKVNASARRESRLQRLQQEIQNTGGICEFVVGDITTQSTRKALAEKTQAKFGGVDILVNNAGVGAMGRFDQASPERIRQIFEVNFFAAVELTREILPELRRGRSPIIVNIGSVLGHRAAPLKSEYSASKFAIHGFSDALRAELAGDVDVLLISPSTTDSEFFDQAIEDHTRKDWKKGGAASPAKVAQKAIRAIEQGRHEVILSAGGKFIVWVDRLFPSLADRLVSRFGQ